MITTPTQVLETLHQWQSAGRRVAVATLVGAEGSSPRPIGSQMLVDSDGERAGILSSGCIEGAIVEQALQALAEDQSRLLRYGKGSPWMDLRLPCGAGIDVLISVHPNPELVQQTLKMLHFRHATEISMNLESGDWSRAGNAQKGGFSQQYEPHWQLHVAGRGPMLAKLAALATTCDMQVIAHGPDLSDLRAASQHCLQTHHLKQAGDFSCEALDHWQAAVVLFHDHDWEPPILQQMLRGEARYIAALGSRNSHAQRVMMLRDMGITEQDIERIKGPAGLNIGGVTPAEIALSIVGEMVCAFRQDALIPQ